MTLTLALHLRQRRAVCTIDWASGWSASIVHKAYATMSQDIKRPFCLESHQGAINVKVFPFFPGQGIWLHPCMPILVWCNCGFFLSFPFIFSLSVIHHNWPIGTTNNWVQVFMLAAPSLPLSFPSLLSLASSAICLPVCLEFNWNIIHIGK